MSSMWSNAPRWTSRVAFYRPDEEGVRLGGLADLRRLWALAQGRDAAILLGAVTLRHRYRDLVFALALKHLRARPPRILLTDATWETGSRVLSERLGLPDALVERLVRLLVRAIDGPHVHYGVLSSAEVETFASTWGVPRERVVFTPFPATIPANTPTTPPSEGDHVFAGGNSLRDYDLLEDALAGTGLRAVVASRWRPRDPGARIEAGTFPHAEFVRLLSSARVVVTPLQRSVRSAGQQTYLNAMLLARPVVVTEAPGVRDYVTDGVTGVIVPPEPAALRAAILDATDPARAEHYAAMGARARADVLQRFTGHRYFDDTLLSAIGLPPQV